MPPIVVASPKGGAGKSTTVVLLGTELAHALEVAQQHEARQGSGRVIDADVREVRK